MDRRKLTLKIKLAAISLKYYSLYKWEPKAGDFFTTSRNDCELYQIVAIDEELVYTKYYEPSFSDTISTCLKDDFLSEHTFGRHRVHVPEWAFKLGEVAYDN